MRERGSAPDEGYTGAHADVAQLARASACHAEGRGFESHHPLEGSPGQGFFLPQDVLSLFRQTGTPYGGANAPSRPTRVYARAVQPTRTRAASQTKFLLDESEL